MTSSPPTTDRLANSNLFARFVELPLFQNFIVGVILFAALLVGLETDKYLVTEYAHLLKFLDRVVLVVFTLELLLKIAAEGRRPWRFFWTAGMSSTS